MDEIKSGKTVEQDRSISTSLIKALDVMTVLTAHGLGIRIVDLGEKLGLPRSTIVRILQTLEEYGLVEHRGKAYALTEGFYRWSRPDRYGLLRRRYQNFLKALSEATEELVLLGVHEGKGIVHIDFIEWDHAIRVAPAPDTVHPFETSAMGKLVLSRRPDLRPKKLPVGWEEELREIRRTGVSWNREESTPGVNVLAMAGFTNEPMEPMVAVAWPVSRFSEKKANAAIKWIREQRGILWAQETS